MSHETPPRGNGQASDQANKVGQASVGTAGRQVNFKARRNGQIRAESFPGTTTDPGSTPTQTDTPTLTDPRDQGSGAVEVDPRDHGSGAVEVDPRARVRGASSPCLATPHSRRKPRCPAASGR